MKISYSPIGNSIQDFEILDKIGYGGFAIVYRAKCLQEGYDDLHVAIKKIKHKEIKKRKLQKRIESEINIHSNVDHPSIVRLYTWFEDENYVYLVLELCEGGSLEEYLKNHGFLSEKDACHFIKQVIDGVRYLHAQNVLHRDLSLRNILLTKNMHVKIADFGMATKLKYPDDKAHTMLGTVNYISPEVVLKDPYDFKADCWSVGCILYALLYGTPPFDGREKKYIEIMRDAVTEPLIFPEHASREAKNLLSDMLNKDPNYRIKINDPLQYLFFQKYEVEFAKRNKTCSQNYSDSGMGSSLSCLHSTNKNPENRKMPSSFQNDRKFFRSISSHESCNKVSGYSSRTCWNNSKSNNVHKQSQRSKSPFSKEERVSESQLHIQSLGDTESLLPFPSHRLQHIVSEDHLTYLSNHSKVQNSCRYGYTNKSHLEKNVELFLEKHPKTVETKSLKDIMEPLNTTRLVPQRCKRRIAIITVLNDGQLCLEFLNMKKKGNLVNCVCNISKDGQTIVLYKPPMPLVPSSEPPALPHDLCNVDCFTFNDLPKCHWKKYWFAKTFVNKTKAKMPKVTVYDTYGKCVMMENIPAPNYEMIFYDGCQIFEENIINQDPKLSYKITKIHRITVKDQNGTTNVITEKNQLDDEFKFMWEDFCTMKNECLEVEAIGKKLGCHFFFPVVCGRRPKTSNGDNSTLQSLHSSPLNAVSIQNSMTMRRSNTTPFEVINKILLQPKEKRTVDQYRVKS